METMLVYSTVLNIPFNKDTTVEWSDTPEFSENFINRAILKIDRILKSGRSISMGRICRILGMRESRLQPNIFFDRLDNAEIDYDKKEKTFTVSLYLTGGYFQGLTDPFVKPQHATETFKPYIVNPEEEFEKMREPKTESENEKCRTGPRETSGSEESGKT